MNVEEPLPRLAETALDGALRGTGVVLVTGPRGVGKRTACAVADPRRRLLDLDDLESVAEARSGPGAMIGEEGVTIAEAQRDLPLTTALLQEGPERGMLLTSSVNLAEGPAWSELLEGAARLTLWPLTRYEQLGSGVAGLWGDLMAASSRDWYDLILQEEGVPEDWTELARRGGLPDAALSPEGSEWRKAWFRSYTRAYLERDVPLLSDVASLLDVRELMRSACLRLGEVVNQAELARETGISGPTAYRYLNLLEASYQLVRVESLQRKGTRRLVKSPKLYWSDTGLAMFLSGEEQARAGHLENLVLGDLLAWRDAQLAPARVSYWRTQLGDEVDFVLEWGGRLLPIQVRESSTVGEEDAVELRIFAEQYGSAVIGGLVLHTGDEVYWLADGVLAAPWWRVF